MLAFHVAGLEHVHPEAGAPWRPRALYAATHPHSGVGELGPLLARVGKTVLSVPDDHVAATVDVTGWLEQKWDAILAHRSEAAQERPLPGILARMPAGQRQSFIATEYFIRLGAGNGASGLRELT
ncbi:hypothetical protein ACF1GT_00565 [Streptomyces sp. NPDC014636]|uniref:hypothetical protein n=1 Tax=Streptomyces sp. NPDC014636 TaxID=3364876 RepID=UPI0036FC3B22